MTTTRREAIEVGLEAAEQLRRRERGAALDGREQLERLIERAEAASERELVDGVADDEHVDERLAAREMRDDAGGELDRGLEAIGVVDVGVEHDADAREVLLLVLAHDGDAGARPAPRVEIAHGIAGAIRAHAEQIHRLAALRRERDAARLVPRRDREREAHDVRDARHDVELHARRSSGAVRTRARPARPRRR